MTHDDIQTNDTDAGLINDIQQTRELIADLVAECRQSAAELDEYLEWLADNDLDSLLDELN